MADGAGCRIAAGGNGASGDVATRGHGQREGPARYELSRSDDEVDCGRVRSERSERSSRDAPSRPHPHPAVASGCFRIAGVEIFL